MPAANGRRGREQAAPPPAAQRGEGAMRTPRLPHASPPCPTHRPPPAPLNINRVSPGPRVPCPPQLHLGTRVGVPRGRAGNPRPGRLGLGTEPGAASPGIPRVSSGHREQWQGCLGQGGRQGCRRGAAQAPARCSSPPPGIWASPGQGIPAELARGGLDRVATALSPCPSVPRRSAAGRTGEAGDRAAINPPCQVRGAAFCSWLL